MCSKLLMVILFTLCACNVASNDVDRDDCDDLVILACEDEVISDDFLEQLYTFC